MGRLQRDEPGSAYFEENITLNGLIDTNQTIANGTANVTISNVAPAGVGTATISKWLIIVNEGVTYYIPMWT